jgi:hypothetical protein
LAAKIGQKIKMTHDKKKAVISGLDFELSDKVFHFMNGNIAG